MNDGELQAAKDWQAGVELAVCFISGCDYLDIDPRGPVWLRDNPTPFYACTEHWEAIFSILGQQASMPDAHHWSALPCEAGES